MKQYIVVLVTAPSSQVARELASALLETRLVACVNIVPNLESHYAWQGELCRDTEQLLIMKTRRERFDKLAHTVREVHPYDVPEIIALPIVIGSKEYLDWIDENVGT